VLKIAAGESEPVTTTVAKVRDVVRPTRSVKRVLVSVVRGLGVGMREIRMVRRARRVVMMAVRSVRSVGVRLSSVGHRSRCQSAERFVLLYRDSMSDSRAVSVSPRAKSKTERDRRP